VDRQTGERVMAYTTQDAIDDLVADRECVCCGEGEMHDFRTGEADWPQLIDGEWLHGGCEADWPQLIDGEWLHGGCADEWLDMRDEES
jgi:hypothetical protein